MEGRREEEKERGGGGRQRNGIDKSMETQREIEINRERKGEINLNRHVKRRETERIEIERE